MQIIDAILDFQSEALDKIIRVLSTNSDGETRIVGGAVRDKLLGITPKDIDLITTLSPKDALKLLRASNIAVIPTGIKFGTITAYIDGQSFEITTLREDTECDGRRAKVVFTKDFAKDAARRDFTINGMSYDVVNHKIYDYFTGHQDLQNKVVQFIGSPPQRIKEDHLRILRFFRFSAKYAQHLDEKGLMACVEQKDRIKFLSPERITSEFNKILQSDGAVEILEIMKDRHLLEEISADLKWDIESYKFFIKEILKIFSSNSHNLDLHYLVLLNQNSWDVIHSELFRLRISNREIRKIYYLKYYEDMIPEGVDIDYLVKLVIFDKKLDFFNFVKYITSVSHIKKKEASNFIIKYQSSLNKEMPVTGDDLKAKFSGVEIGNKLKELRDFWIESNFKLSRNELLKKVNAK